MVTSGQGVLRQMLAVFSFGVDTTELEKGKKKVGSILKDMQKVAQAFAGGWIAKSVGGFVKDTVDEMMQIRRGAAELRITTDEMQGLQIAAKATGSDAKWLAMSMERLQVNVERAARGGKHQSESMRQLGLTTHDANGKTKSATELYLETADALSKMTDQNKQALVVRDLFGIGGHRQLPILRMGRKAIEELMNITKEYGMYEKEVIEQSAHYTVTLLKLEGVWRGIKSYVMSNWLPVLEKQTDKLIKGAQWFMKLAKNSLIAEAALRVLQAAMVGLALKMAIAFPYATALAAGLGLLVLVLDDLLVFFSGGHSLLGDVIDKLWGKGAKEDVIKGITDAWDGLVETVKDFGQWLKDHPEFLTGIKLILGAMAWTAQTTGMGLKAAGDATAWVAGKVKNREGVHALSPGERTAALAGGGGASEFVGPPMSANQAAPSVRVSIGDVHVTAPPGADAKAHGKAVADAVDERLSHHIKTGMAALRREKQQ